MNSIEKMCSAVHIFDEIQKEIIPKEEISVNDDFSKIFLCADCKKIFRSKKSLKDHIKIHNGEKPYLW